MFIRFNIIKQSKPIAFSLAALFVTLTFTACLKQTALYTPQEGVVYMPQAYQDKSKVQPLIKIDTVQETTFGFYYTSWTGAPTDIEGTFEVDTTLVAKYNEENAYTGIVYKVLPDSVYTISGTTTVLKAGKTTSEPLTLGINPKSLDMNEKYMLPIKLVSVSSGTINTELAIAFFRVDEITIRKRDFTRNGVLTGNHTNSPANESLPKLVDSNFNSKYLAFDYTPSLWVQLKFPQPYKLDAYTITSGNDAPERDPKVWHLDGSNDGINWTTIDSRSDTIWLNRNETKTFNLDQEAEYSHYRLNITAINGASLIQISEWRLLDYY